MYIQPENKPLIPVFKPFYFFNRLITGKKHAMAASGMFRARYMPNFVIIMSF